MNRLMPRTLVTARSSSHSKYLFYSTILSLHACVWLTLPLSQCVYRLASKLIKQLQWSRLMSDEVCPIAGNIGAYATGRQYPNLREDRDCPGRRVGLLVGLQLLS